MARDITAFQRELDRQADRQQRTRSSGSDFTWYKTRKPAKVGDKVRSRLRILPRPTDSGEPAEEFWVGVDQHILTLDGKTKVYVCPDDHDVAKGQTVCPLCALSRTLYEGRDPAMLDMARDLSVRRRVFANIADLEEGAPQVMVWGFSQSLLSGLLDICVAKRAFIDDPEDGRDIMLTCNRTGPQARDIRYAVTDMDPSPIDAAYASLVEEANDLAGLSTPADIDELAEVASILDPRPGGKRVSAPAKVSAPVAPPAPAAPSPPAPVAQSNGEWHYVTLGGETKEGLSLEDIVKAIGAEPDADHDVWTEGMDAWAEARTLPAIQELLEAAAPKKPGPPKRKKSAPSPPQPPGGKAF